jgi:hypothetical protein
MALTAFAPAFPAVKAVQDPVAGDQPASVDGTAARDGAGGPSRPSSGGPPVATPQRMVELLRTLEQPFTVGTLVRAVERSGIPVSEALRWLRGAQGTVVTDTGARRASGNALRGARLYRLRGI